jgi:hypothetical protein
MKQFFHLLTLWDKLLVLLLVTGALISFVIVFWTTHEGSTVIISSPDGEIRKPLNTDQNFVVSGPLGKTRVIIHDHRTWITSSPCPNKLCIHMGKIHRSGEIIVCVPNQVSVRVVGKEKTGVDATTM